MSRAGHGQANPFIRIREKKQTLRAEAGGGEGKRRVGGRVKEREEEEQGPRREAGKMKGERRRNQRNQNGDVGRGRMRMGEKCVLN